MIKTYPAVLFFKIVLIIFTLAAIPPSVLSSDKNGKIDKAGTNLHITSDTMFAEQESLSIKFSGNVVVTRDDTLLHADVITVILFSEEEKNELGKETDKRHGNGNQRDIKEIAASGNVTFKFDDGTAYADHAVYTALDQILVLTGDSPRVVTGESHVTGKKIVLNQKSSEIVVEGDASKRVEALFKSVPGKP
ncbi:MAG: hypothetical protein HQK66_09430 [Desulfamplus sp.]|nr:hypothetical protein [Desulfamplus sp.]